MGGSLQELWNCLTVRWARKSFGLSSSWETDRISMVHKGGRKIASNMVVMTLTMQTLLVTKMVKEVVQFANDDKTIAVLASFLLTGRKFLVRMPTAGMGCSSCA